MEDKFTVAVWPDGTWCNDYEIGSYLGYLSDDYFLLKVPAEFNYDDTDNLVMEMLNGR